jgi:hypothetical protein
MSDTRTTETKCPECYGTGEIWRHVSDRRGGSLKKALPCPKCKQPTSNPLLAEAVKLLERAIVDADAELATDIEGFLLRAADETPACPECAEMKAELFEAQRLLGVMTTAYGDGLKEIQAMRAANTSTAAR